jgi:hypothetical protein
VFPPPAAAAEPPVVGVKIYEHEGELGPLFTEFRDLGFNTLFVSAWADWKRRLVTSMAEDIAGRARAARPGILINVHAVPWRRDDFGGARRKVVAQDPTALSRIADFLSPMCYSAMLHRNPEWIASVVKDLAAESSVPFLPSIQVKESYPGDLELGAADFEAALTCALEPPSAGVVLWSWDLIGKAPESKAAIKRRFGPRRTVTIQ